MKTRRFSPDQIRKIRETYATTKRTLASLAREYGCTPGMISSITTGIAYQDAPGVTGVVFKRTKPKTCPPRLEPQPKEPEEAKQTIYADLGDFRRLVPVALRKGTTDAEIETCLASASAQVEAVLREQGYVFPLTSSGDELRHITCGIAAVHLLLRHKDRVDPALAMMVGENGRKARELLQSFRATKQPSAVTVGSTVRLVSGGPPMTVLQVNGDTICTTWFDASARNHAGTFPMSAIEVVS